MIDRIAGMEAGGKTPSADEVREKAMRYAASAREQLAHGTDAVRSFTTHQPARALGIALAIGVALGWLIKRR